MKYLGHPFLTAVLAGLMQLLAMKCGYAQKGVGVAFFIAWVGFAAWACYFLAGCTPKGGAKVIGCWVGGVIGSIAIIEIGTKLCGVMPPLAAFPIAVFLIAFAVICFEKVPALDMIPAWFVGAACFFGYNTYIGDLFKAKEVAMTNMELYKISVPAILISVVIGQIFGVVTVTVRGKYQEMVDGGAAEEAKEEEAQAA